MKVLLFFLFFLVIQIMARKVTKEEEEKAIKECASEVGDIPEVYLNAEEGSLEELAKEPELKPSVLCIIKKIGSPFAELEDELLLMQEGTLSSALQVLKFVVLMRCKNTSMMSPTPEEQAYEMFKCLETQRQYISKQLSHKN